MAVMTRDEMVGPRDPNRPVTVNSALWLLSRPESIETILKLKVLLEEEQRRDPWWSAKVSQERQVLLGKVNLSLAYHFGINNWQKRWRRAAKRLEM